MTALPLELRLAPSGGLHHEVDDDAGEDEDEDAGHNELPAPQHDHAPELVLDWRRDHAERLVRLQSLNADRPHWEDVE